jgi:thiazole synthase
MQPDIAAVGARALRELRERAPQIPLIVDAGIGLPSHACQVMAIDAGRSAFLAGPMIVQALAVPSTPEIGRPFSESAALTPVSVHVRQPAKI